MEETKNELVVIDDKSIQVKDTAWNSLAEESKKAYASDYKLFFEFINKDPKDITASDILLYIEHLEGKDYKNNSINRKLASLSKMFRVMVLSGDITVNPIDILKQYKNISHKTSKGISIGLNIDDIKKAVEITENSTVQDKKIVLIIRMLATTGLRISEFINIKNRDISDFDDENQVINIVGKGKKERKIYLSNEFLAEIRALYPMEKELSCLFYTIRRHKYDRKVLWKQIRLFFWDRIKKDVHPHLLRHFYATYKINVEKQDIKAVSKFLGHSDVSITLNAYVDTALNVEDSKIKI